MIRSRLRVIVIPSLLALGAAQPRSGGQPPALARIRFLDGDSMVMTEPRLRYSWTDRADYARYYNPPWVRAEVVTWYCWGGWRDQRVASPLSEIRRVSYQFRRATLRTASDVLWLHLLRFQSASGVATVLSIPDERQDMCLYSGATPSLRAPSALRADAHIPADAMIDGTLLLSGKCADRTPCEVPVLPRLVNRADRASTPLEIRFE
jgi:hypothetical protein